MQKRQILRGLCTLTTPWVVGRLQELLYRFKDGSRLALTYQYQRVRILPEGERYQSLLPILGQQYPSIVSSRLGKYRQKIQPTSSRKPQEKIHKCL